MEKGMTKNSDKRFVFKVVVDTKLMGNNDAFMDGIYSSNIDDAVSDVLNQMKLAISDYFYYADNDASSLVKNEIITLEKIEVDL